MTSFLNEMETLKIPEKVVFWAIEHVFFGKSAKNRPMYIS